MTNRLFVAAALAVCCASGAGCRGVMTCGDDCGQGCSMAFQKFDCCRDSGCGQCWEGQAAACGCSSGCDAGCDDCGACDPPVRRLMGALWGCTGCGECYWHEWHNDPPSLCEPCDRCGNYVGPGRTGYYRAPYRHHDALIADREPAAPPLELAETAL